MKRLSMIGESLKAWNEGRKSEARRLMDPQPNFPFGVKRIIYVPDPLHNNAFAGTPAQGMGRDGVQEMQLHCEDFAGNLVARYMGTHKYNPGETVYIGEPWRVWRWCADDGCVKIQYSDGSISKWVRVPDDDWMWVWSECCEDAVDAGLALDSNSCYVLPTETSPCRWREPNTMPEWAARSWAKITSVRAERLQDITDSGAIAEGYTHVTQEEDDENCHDAVSEFVWDIEIIYPGAWDRNDWVWVYGLERLSKPE